MTKPTLQEINGATQSNLSELPESEQLKSIRAMEFAVKAHEGQLRDGGEPYIKHPAQVAQIISLVTDDDELIAAAWLHDVLEDTPVSFEVLEARFGSRVANLVNEVTHEGDDRHGYYFPRLNTQAGIMLKFADRLSNISDMGAWSDRRRTHYMKKSVFWRQEQRIDMVATNKEPK